MELLECSNISCPFFSAFYINWVTFIEWSANTDCGAKLSNVKRMDVWTVVRTVLEKSPGIKAKELIRKVREKTGLARSTIYDRMASFELQGKIYREKGRYYLEKPQKPSKPSWWERRAERKFLEKKYNDERLDESIRELQCELAINREEMLLDEDDPRYLEKINEIEYKWRKKYGLI